MSQKTAQGLAALFTDAGLCWFGG